jgi:hypothetical protein
MRIKLSIKKCWRREEKIIPQVVEKNKEIIENFH